MPGGPGRRVPGREGQRAAADEGASPLSRQRPHLRDVGHNLLVDGVADIGLSG